MTTDIPRPRRQAVIGLLGGCSNVATGAYYQFLNDAANARMGGWDIAETLIAGMNFGNIEAFVRANDWDSLDAYMDKKVARLVAGGADLLLCVSNTLHKQLEPIAARHGIKMIHIVDPTAAAIQAAGLNRVALFGTKPVMATDYLISRYEQMHGLEIVVPTEAEQDDIDRIIFDELVKGRITTASRDRYVAIAERLSKEAGAQGVILGCTEIFLLLRQEDTPQLPLFNTAQLHCAAAVDYALSDVFTSK